MLRAAEYKHNAEECREQAKQMLRSEDRDSFEQIAQFWERLANARERHPEPELEAETLQAKAAGPSTPQLHRWQMERRRQGISEFIPDLDPLRV
jgi:hypothetical protein